MEQNLHSPSNPLVYEYLDQFPDADPSEVLSHYHDLRAKIFARADNSHLKYSAFQEAFMLMPADNITDPTPVMEIFGHFLQTDDVGAASLALASLPNFSKLFPNHAGELLNQYIGGTHLSSDEKVEALGIALVGGMEIATSVDGVVSLNAHRLNRGHKV